MEKCGMRRHQKWGGGYEVLIALIYQCNMWTRVGKVQGLKVAGVGGHQE